MENEGDAIVQIPLLQEKMHLQNLRFIGKTSDANGTDFGKTRKLSQMPFFITFAFISP
jgi:hypothetical protein